MVLSLLPAKATDDRKCQVSWRPDRGRHHVTTDSVPTAPRALLRSGTAEPRRGRNTKNCIATSRGYSTGGEAANAFSSDRDNRVLSRIARPLRDPSSGTARPGLVGSALARRRGERIRAEPDMVAAKIEAGAGSQRAARRAKSIAALFNLSAMTGSTSIRARLSRMRRADLGELPCESRSRAISA
jgi:hypothetical protein